MDEGLSVKIGVTTYKLRKSSHRFRVIRPQKSLIANLLRDRRVRGIYEESGSVLRVVLQDSSDLDRLMYEVRSSHVAHHSYFISDDPFEQPFIPTGIVLLSVSDDITRVRKLASKFALTLLGFFRSEPPIYRLALTSLSPGNPIKISNAISAELGVRFCEPDYLTKTHALQMPKHFSDQWHLDKHSPGLDIMSAWELSRGDPSVVLCVFDDGFDLTNPDLQGGVVYPSDFAPYDEDPEPSQPIFPADQLPYANAQIGDYHGTPCAGLAIARGVDSVIGVAPGCSWMPVRARFGFSSLDLTLRIFEYISQYADVVSCSWGARPSPFEAPSSSMLEVMENLTRNGGRRGSGLVVCFAAGNENLPTHLDGVSNGGLEYYDDSTGRRLGSFFKGHEIHSGWCEVPGSIIVGAITSEGEKASYSNWGAEISVCAPSGEWQVQQSPQERKANSPKLWTTDNEIHGRGLAQIGLGDAELGMVTNSMTGTSGATPLVAGTCALLLSRYPDMSAGQICEVVKQSASRSELKVGGGVKSFANNNGQDGAFDQNGHSIWYGYGRISPLEALKKVSS